MSRQTLTIRLLVSALFCFALFIPGHVSAQQTSLDEARSAYNEPMLAAPATYGGTTLPPRTYRAPGWEWDHEVRIWLPDTYFATEKDYPTIWVTDNSLEEMIAALRYGFIGLSPEVIIVAIGAPSTTAPAEFIRRRNKDLNRPNSELAAEAVRFPDGQVGGAPGFLDFLVNQLRPELEEEFRMDSNSHNYAGHSLGANFGLYVLFTKPESFRGYLLSSPARRETQLAAEAKWNEGSNDLPAKVFISAGEWEAAHPYWHSFDLISTASSLAERLTGRNYPSLELRLKVFSEEDHQSVMPVAYARGVRFLFEDARTVRD